jgi:hypothetical protein
MLTAIVMQTKNDVILINKSIGRVSPSYHTSTILFSIYFYEVLLETLNLKSEFKVIYLFLNNTNYVGTIYVDTNSFNWKFIIRWQTGSPLGRGQAHWSWRTIFLKILGEVGR